MRRVFCFNAFAVMVGYAANWDDANPSKIKFKVPELSEEEEFSGAIPQEFRCDACKAAIYQVTNALDRLKPRDPKALLKASGKIAAQRQAAAVAEALEDACDAKRFEDYGLKVLLETGEGGSSQKRLHGPGIEYEGAGSIQGGGRWPSRIRAKCEHIVGEEEESNLVMHWIGGSLPGICDVDCGKAQKDSAPAKRRKQKAIKSKPRPSPKKENPAPTGLEELPPPPYTCQTVDRLNMSAFLGLEGERRKKRPKFSLVLFFSTSARSAHAVAVLELAARKFEKAKESDLRKMKHAVARYNSTDGDMYDYNWSVESLPKMLFWRKGYRNPKAFDGSMDGPDLIFDWLRNQILNVYMKDDPEKFPRASAERSEL